MAENFEILAEQEEKLQFDSFDQDTAWKLGCFMVEYAKKKHITIAACIRMNDGCIVFQHCPDGTNALNQRWMERKFNLVKLTGHSSLLTALNWEKDGQTAATHGLEEMEYAVCGGGFPIRIKGSKTALGAVIASNLFHIADHEFVVNCLKEFLNLPEVPDYPYEEN